MSLQVLENYADVSEALPQASERFIQDYLALKQETIEKLNLTEQALESLQPQFGNGSPEGVITSNLNRTYFDTSGVNAIMYINEIIGSDTGWQEVN